jgi:hypothetical protein
MCSVPLTRVIVQVVDKLKSELMVSCALKHPITTVWMYAHALVETAHMQTQHDHVHQGLLPW